MRILPSGVSLTGLAMGVGIVLLAPAVLPMIGAVLKPVAKAAIKGGIMAYETAKVSLAEAKESIEDLTAEAKSEVSSGK